MGQVYSACSRPFSAIQSIGELYDPELSISEIFQAIKLGDADRVSRLLEEYHFDLTIPDPATGDTMLHRAIEYHHEDVVARLLSHAARDPAVLNARGRYQDTPLVRAAVMQRVPLMLALFNEGGRVDDPHLNTWLMNWKPGQRRGWQLAAELLVRAQGDISEALKLAVQYEDPCIANMYRLAGASCIPALRLGAQAIRWMARYTCIRGEDALEVLEHAQRSGDTETINALLASDTVCEVIFGLTNYSGNSRVALIRQLVATGTDAAKLVSVVVDRYKQTLQEEFRMYDYGKFLLKGRWVLRDLIAAGLPTAHALVEQSRHPGSIMVPLLIELGADVPGALPQLEPTAAANLASMALESILKKKGLSEANKTEKLQEIIRKGGADGAMNLACLLCERSTLLDDVVRLIRCGATLSKALIMALVDLVYSAEHDRTPGQVAGELPGRRMFRKLIEAGVDLSPVVTALHHDSAGHTMPSGPRGAPTLQDAISAIRYAQLQHLLGKTSLSLAEKTEAVKVMISQDAKQAAGELLRDAVLANHPATMKLLVLAGAPAIDTFMELGRQLVPGATDLMLKTRALIHLGADFQPAMRQLTANANAYVAAGDLTAAENEREALRQLGFTVALVMQRSAVIQTQ